MCSLFDARTFLFTYILSMVLFADCSGEVQLTTLNHKHKEYGRYAFDSANCHQQPSTAADKRHLHLLFFTQYNMSGAAPRFLPGVAKLIGGPPPWRGLLSRGTSFFEIVSYVLNTRISYARTPAKLGYSLCGDPDTHRRPTAQYLASGGML